MNATRNLHACILSAYKISHGRYRYYDVMRVLTLPTCGELLLHFKVYFLFATNGKHINI